MVFNITDKVAIITGGASGIGLRYAKELLRNGAKGVTLADINTSFGENALLDIEKEFGPNKAIFIETDVSNIKQFEDAFKKTIEIYKNVDILINNAGILNDSSWERSVKVNVNGVVNGVVLGMDKFLPKHKSGTEAVVVNTSSVAGIQGLAVLPVYSGTKFAVHGMTIAWGHDYHYCRSKVRVIGICPGATKTPLVTDMGSKTLGAPYETELKKNLGQLPYQTPEQCASRVVDIIKNAPNGSIWVVEGGEPAYQFVIPHRNTFKL